MPKLLQAALWALAMMLVAIAEVVGWAPEGFTSKMILIVPLAAVVSMGMWKKSGASNRCGKA